MYSYIPYLLVGIAAVKIIAHIVNKENEIVLCAGFGCHVASKCHHHTAAVDGTQTWLSSTPETANGDGCQMYLSNHNKERAADWRTRADNQYCVRQ